MRTYLFLIFYTGRSRPDHYNAAGNSLPEALAILMVNARIHITEIDRIEIYP